MPSTAWADVLANPPPGAHVIFWRDGSPACDDGAAAFLRGALARNDLILVVLPEAELHALQDAMRSRGIDFDDLVDRGFLVRAIREEVAPHTPREIRALERTVAGLLEFGKCLGRTGLSAFGDLAAGFFETGEYEMAELIERMASELPPSVRMVCTYNARSLRMERLAEALALIRAHTHAVTALGRGRFFVETVGPADPVVAA